jgi:hypothetical protein
VSAHIASWQGLLVGLSLAAIRAFGWTYEATALWGGAALVAFVLFARGFFAYRRSGGVSKPTPIQRREHVAIAVGWIGLGVPWVVLVFTSSSKGFIDITGSGHQSAVLAMLVIAAVALYFVFFSTLIDWSYVRPRLRGAFGAICGTSMRKLWRRTTQIWLFHRAVAMFGGIAAITGLVALGANNWVRPIDETVAGVIATVATIIAGYYLTRAASVLAIAINPPIQVGDVIEIAEEFRVHQPGKLREYFVVDVAMEGAKLLQLGENDSVTRSGPDAGRTHDRTVDVLEIAKLLRGRRPATPCAPACRHLTEHCACISSWAPPDQAKETKKKRWWQRDSGVEMTEPV